MKTLVRKDGEKDGGQSSPREETHPCTRAQTKPPGKKDGGHHWAVLSTWGNPSLYTSPCKPNLQVRKMAASPLHVRKPIPVHEPKPNLQVRKMAASPHHVRKPIPVHEPKPNLKVRRMAASPHFMRKPIFVQSTNQTRPPGKRYGGQPSPREKTHPCTFFVQSRYQNKPSR